MLKNESYKEKFIAFIDILGFKEIVKKSVEGTGRSIEEIKELFDILDSFDSKKQFNLCPQANRNSSSLDFEITQISDCVIMSSEISSAGIINLIEKSYIIASKLLRKGCLCRGYIDKGVIYHKGKDIIGTGYQDTYLKESEVSIFANSNNEKGTPFIEIDKKIHEYIIMCDDKCVQKFFGRMTIKAGMQFAIFPFHSFNCSFILADGKGVQSNLTEKQTYCTDLITKIDEIKTIILSNSKTENPKALEKIRHYIEALENKQKELKLAYQMIGAFRTEER